MTKHRLWFCLFLNQTNVHYITVVKISNNKCDVGYRGIHADVIVYIFALSHTTLHTEENLSDIY